MLFIQLISFLICLGCLSATETCDRNTELPCDDGSCIQKLLWCEGVVHCEDGSDEKYCNGDVPCNRSLHFECRNKKCIPASSSCDGYDDCGDSSDERNCTAPSWLEDYSLMDFLPEQSSHFQRLNDIDKAVQYILNMRNSENGWGTFTPRAVVALSMASRVSPIAQKNKELMLKHLNILILQDLMKNRHVTLSSLALYINALYATCQDPRNFQGMDLIARLRSETDAAMQSKSSIPLAFFTLCLSNSTRYGDNFNITNLYNSRDYEMRTGSKALLIMAMVCIMHKDQNKIFEAYVSDFFSEELKAARIADVYTKALFVQASIAAGFPYPSELKSKQLSDGSFGDLLSTYYEIPAMLNASLLELVCNSPSKRSVMDIYSDQIEGRKEVYYSLWIPTGKDVVSHSIIVRFYGKKSLFYIMTVAASKDPLYRFLYDEVEQVGKRVYSVAGIPNDVEGGTSWLLYHAETDVKVNSAEGLQLLDIGIDNYFPDDKDHLIFWMKRIVKT